MAKLVLSDLTNLSNSSAISTVNANNRDIEDAIENTLSRDGSTPNQMEADLDMNSNRIINLPAAVSATEPVRKREFDTGLFAIIHGNSITSNTIGTGSKSFIVESGLGFVAGMYALVLDANNPDNLLSGQITDYDEDYVDGPRLTIDVSTIAGSGTHANWDIYLAGAPGVAGEDGEDGVGGSGSIGISPMDYGAFGDGTSHRITLTDIANNPDWIGPFNQSPLTTYPVGTEWDTVAVQEAIYAAFASTSTPGNVVWNSTIGARNSQLFFPKGKYLLNRQVTMSATGFTVTMEERHNTKLAWQGYDAFTDDPDVGTWGFKCNSHTSTTLDGISADDIAQLHVGMYVRDANTTTYMPEYGTIPGNTTIDAIDVGAGSVTLSNATTSSVTGLSIFPFTSMLQGEAVAYGRFDNLTIQADQLLPRQSTGPVGSTATALMVLDSGLGIGLSTQQITFINFTVFGEGKADVGLSIAPVTGGSGQGDTIVFLNPGIFVCERAGYEMNGNNAVDNVFIGGDVQGCRYWGIYCNGGTIHVDGTSFQNQAQGAFQFAPANHQATQVTYDIHAYGPGGSNSSSIKNVRSEAMCGVEGSSQVTVESYQIAGVGPDDWETTQWPLGHIIYPSDNNTRNRMFMCVATGESIWHPMLDDGMSLPDTLTVRGTSPGWSVDQWVGYCVYFRYENSFIFNVGEITSNTADSVTISGSGIGTEKGVDKVFMIIGSSDVSAPDFDSIDDARHFPFGNTGRGYTMSANTTTFSNPDVNLNDYCVIPDADSVGIFAPWVSRCPIRAPLIGLVTADLGGGDFTLDKPSKYGVFEGRGYAGASLADGTQGVVWMECPFWAFDTLESLDFSSFAGYVNRVKRTRGSYLGSLATDTGQPVLRVSGGGWNLQNNNESVNLQYGPSWRTIWFTGSSGTVDIANAITRSDVIGCTPTGDITFNAPVPLGQNMSQRFSLHILTSGTDSYDITFGANFNSQGVFSTGTNDAAKFVITFESDNDSWNEVSRTPYAVGSGGLSDTDYGDITVSGSGTAMTIDNNVVTYAKMQNVSTDSVLLGRGDSGAGDPEEITLGTNLSMSGTTLNATGSGGLTDVVDDTSPQLGGDLDLNSNDITGTGDINITGTAAFSGGLTIDATTESNIESAIDTLANLTSIQGRTVTLADAGADAFLGWDDSANAYENLTAAEAIAILLTADGAGSGLDADLLDGKNTGTSGNTIPLLDGTNTWSGVQTFGNTGIVVGASTPFSDSAGTLTLQNIDALDATTESTIEAAIDTLANLVSVQGRTVTLADAGADAIFGWDDSANAYLNLSAADAFTVIKSQADAVYQPLDADLTTWAGLTPSANAQSLVTAANYAAMRALLDLEAGTDFYSIAAADAAFQPKDADLTTWAGLTPSANAQSLVTAANYAAMRALLDLEAGTDFYSIAAADAAFQPIDADLTSIAALTTTTAGRSILTVADPNLDRLPFWDDSAGSFKLGVIADFTTEATPASGDKLFIQRAGTDDLAIIDWDDLPGASAGISDVVDDTTPQLGGDLDLNSFNIFGTGSVSVGSSAPIAFGAVSFGGTPLIQVNDTTPNAGFAAARYNAASTGPKSLFIKSRGTTAGDFTGAVLAEDKLGTFAWLGADGVSDTQEGAALRAVAEQDFDDTNSPARLEFLTTPVGSNISNIRMTIGSEGDTEIVGTPDGSNGMFRVLSLGSTYVSHFENTVGADNFNTFRSTSGAGEFGIWTDAFYFQSLDNLANGIQFIEGSDGTITSAGGITFNAFNSGIVRVENATLRLEAGTTSIAPLTFQSGTNLTTAAAGVMEYDGKVFYGDFAASRRGVIPTEQFISLSATQTATSSNAAQTWFPGGGSTTLNVEASTTYQFEGELHLANGTTTHTTALLFALAGGASLTSIKYDFIIASVIENTAGVNGLMGTINQASSTVINATSAAAGAHIYVRGIMRVNAAGTIAPQFQWSANPTGTNQVLLNTWFRMWPIGTNTVLTVV